MENDVGINSSQDIVQHYPISSSHLFQETNRRGFDDIEKAKEEKSDRDEKESLGDPEHGDKISHDLVDDDPSIIAFLPVVLGLLCNPA